MPAFDLIAHRRKHNALAAAKGFAWLVAAAAGWCLSYGIIWALFAIPVTMLGQMWNWTPSAATCRLAAWIGVALLAVEGVRYGKPLFDLESYSESIYHQAYLEFRDKPFARRAFVYGNPTAAPYIVTQVLFFAPRATVNSLMAFRSLVFLKAAVLNDALSVIEDLRPRRDWMPATHYASRAGALYALYKLKVIWQREKNDELQVRLDPDFSNG